MLCASTRSRRRWRRAPRPGARRASRSPRSRGGRRAPPPCGLLAPDRVDVIAPGAAPLGAGFAEADQMDLVAALGERARLALDPRVQVEVRVVHHADAQQRPRAASCRGPARSAAPSATGAPFRRSEASAASSTATISSPSAALERGSQPVRIACAKSCSSRLERLGGVDARDDHVAGAVGELVLAEARRRGRRRSPCRGRRRGSARRRRCRRTGPCAWCRRRPSGGPCAARARRPGRWRSCRSRR